MPPSQENPTPNLIEALKQPPFLVNLLEGKRISGSLTRPSDSPPVPDSSPSVRGFIETMKRMNGIYQIIGRPGPVICPDFFDTIAETGDLQEEISQSIEDANFVCLLALCCDPKRIAGGLPQRWNDHPPANVAVAAVLDGDMSADSRRIQELKKVSVRCRGVVIPPGLDLATCDLSEIDFILVDFSGGFQGTSANWPEEIQAVGFPGVVIGYPRVSEMHTTNGKSNSAITHADEILAAEIPKTITPEESIAGASDSDREPFHHLVLMANISDITTKSDDLVTPVSGNSRFHTLNLVVLKGLETAADALSEIRRDQLWREGGYESWDAYCNSVLGKSMNYVNRLIKGGKLVQELINAQLPQDSTGLTIRPTSENQVRPLGKLKDPQQRTRAWREAVERADGLPTEKIVEVVVAELMPETENSSAKPKPLSKAHRRRLLLDNLIKAAEAKTSWKTILTLTRALSELN